MIRKALPLIICLLALSLVITGCSKADDSGTASPGASPSPDSSATPSTSPSPSASPDGFVMGTVASISGNTITLSVVTHNSDSSTTNTEKSITVDSSTSYAVSGSLKAATISDIAVGDVITASLAGTTALKIIDNGPDINPDPSSYISPSPSPTPSPSEALASASPSASANS